jgi:hypothetical protein
LTMNSLCLLFWLNEHREKPPGKHAIIEYSWMVSVQRYLLNDLRENILCFGSFHSHNHCWRKKNAHFRNRASNAKALNGQSSIILPFWFEERIIDKLMIILLHLFVKILKWAVNSSVPFSSAGHPIWVWERRSQSLIVWVPIGGHPRVFQSTHRWSFQMDLQRIYS